MSNHISDVMDQLAHFRPEAENLEERWPTAQRAELAERIRRGEFGVQAGCASGRPHGGSGRDAAAWSRSQH
ncbi:MAG: hypothetical protein WKF73_05940 [Nocardioidaceae bacterium]